MSNTKKPQTVVTTRLPHPNAFLQVPVGTEITVHWPDLDKGETVKRMFWEVAVGRNFQFNGNEYIKQSTRTARMLANDRIFYIGQKDIVQVFG